MLSPLADPVYRRLFAAQTIALVGTGLATVALALLAYDLVGGDAGAVLGTALALKMVAYVGVAYFFASIPNVIVDHDDKTTGAQHPFHLEYSKAHL